MDPYDEVIDILLKVKGKITPVSDMMWTSYETPDELMNEIDFSVAGARRRDSAIMEKIDMHFLPASTFQEHSLQNGWSVEYNALAERFDKIYESLK